jgi:hypothetical protein
MFKYNLSSNQCYSYARLWFLYTCPSNTPKRKTNIRNMMKTLESPVIHLYSEHEDATGFWPSWGYNWDLFFWPIPFHGLLEILSNSQLNPLPLHCPGLCCHFIKKGRSQKCHKQSRTRVDFTTGSESLSGWASLSQWLTLFPSPVESMYQWRLMVFEVRVEGLCAWLPLACLHC